MVLWFASYMLIVACVGCGLCCDCVVDFVVCRCDCCGLELFVLIVLW